MRNLSCGLLVVLIAACGADPRNQTGTAADEAKVEQVVVSFFESLGAGDLESAKAAVTPGIELVQDTVVFNWAAFEGYVGPLMETGARVSYEFSDFNTEVRDAVAWTRYRSRSAVQMNGQTIRSEWLESAVLEWVDDEWRIDRLQSTSIWIETEGT